MPRQCRLSPFVGVYRHIGKLFKQQGQSIDMVEVRVRQQHALNRHFISIRQSFFENILPYWEARIDESTPFPRSQPKIAFDSCCSVIKENCYIVLPDSALKSA